MNTNPQLVIPESIISAAATILRQYAPEITSDFLKAALAQYYDYGDNPDNKRLIQRKLTRQECCQILGISINTLHRYIHMGYLKPIRLGARLVRIDPESVRNLLENGIPAEAENKPETEA